MAQTICPSPCFDFNNRFVLLHFLQQLFRPDKPSSPAWQAVALTPAQAIRHARWVKQEIFLNWLAPYFKAYHLRKGGAGGTRGYQVQPLNEAGREGALLLYDDSIGPGNFRHFYEHLGERVMALGYHRACADRCADTQAGHSQTTLKQLFKPNPTDCPQTGQCNQRYGLITVDFVQLDGQAAFIRLASNAVLESCFTPAKPFSELMHVLLDASPPTAATQAQIPEYYAAF